MRTHAKTTLAAALWPRHGLLGSFALVLGANLLLAASAWMKVPMWPVPMTMQTFAVLLIGATCGARLGAAAVAATLVEAALGLPVLAGAVPLLALGPTAGYLAGFLLAVAAVGLAADRGWTHRTLPLLVALLAGEALIYLPGLAWLYGALLHDARASVAAGLLAFLPGEAAKLALAAAVIVSSQRRAAWRSGN
jgi:biotin transport system substrate-specific component